MTNVVLTDHHLHAVCAENTITSGGLAMVRDYLMATQSTDAPLGPTYIALGFGAIPDGGRFWTVLSGESLRFPIVQRQATTAGAVFTAFIPSGNGLGLVVNVTGLWAGNATAALGTGILVAQTALPGTVQLLSPYSIAWTLSVQGTSA